MDAAKRKRLLARASEVLGAESFNRLVTSASETRAKGRLRFWQEELLAHLSAETDTLLVTIEEFLAVFEGAELLPIPKKPPRAVTKEEFLSDPVAIYLDSSVLSIPADWFRQAWDKEAEEPEKCLRKFVIGGIWHEANKGCLPLIAGELRSLAAVLRADQWLRMYEDLREQEPHIESEIREEFVKVASASTAELPPPLTREEVVRLLGSEELARDLGVFDDEAATSGPISPASERTTLWGKPRQVETVAPSPYNM
jgi:hypothetical protein